MSEDEITNFETRKSLISLNQSLFFSEIMENIDLVIPFDNIKIGSKLKNYMGNYLENSIFHQSSIQTLVV
jgi:hypothetical protein